MASFVYTQSLVRGQQEGMNLVAGDIRCLLLKETDAAGQDRSHATLAAVLAAGLNAEADATNYAREALATKVVTKDDINHRAEYSFDDVVFTALGGTLDNTIVAVVLFLHITDDANSIPLSFHDIADTATDGTDFTLQVGTDGAVHWSALST